MTAAAAPAARTPARTCTARTPASGWRMTRWGMANLTTVAWTLFPVWWLADLAFKDPATLTDGSFWPVRWSLANFAGIFLVFMFCWNEFLLAIVLTLTNAARTAPAAMSFFTGVSQFTFPFGSIAAAAVVITIPIVIFVAIFQR
jgi:ABC-type glycerol-3-phosphate transport system permease component